MHPAIRVEHLSKRYKLGQTHAGSIREIAGRVTDRLLGRNHQQLSYGSNHAQAASEQADGDYFWALDDVSFDIEPGEVLGVIGRNGAGKSTLLKILSRITSPTSGRVEINGRVASLLEVGTGFHPELTGRENVYLNGAILGMTRAEIRSRFDEIVAFAEVDKFVDTPVKRYSSGMYVRLAFAVAAHLEPEILVVDEVLSVGDTEFQRKCLGKMGDVAMRGRTVLFVSHNMPAVQQLCGTATFLESGRVSFHGATAEAVEAYSKSFDPAARSVYEVEDMPRYDPSLSRRVQFVRVEVLNPGSMVLSDECVDFVLTVRASDAVETFRFSVTIFRYDGTPVGSAFGAECHSLACGEQASFRFSIPDHSLAPGRYYCDLSTGTGDHLSGHRDFDTVRNVLHFDVAPPKGDGGTVGFWTPGWGVVRFPAPNEHRLAGDVSG